MHVSSDRLPSAARLPDRRPVRQRRSAPRRANTSPPGFLVISRRAVLDRLLHGRLRRGRDVHRAGAALDPVRRSLTADWALRIDTLTAVMLVVVNTVSALVHIYSIGYMHHDPRPAALLRLSVAVHLRHADAGDGRQSGPDVLRLGRRRPRVLSADRLLVQEAVGQCRGDQGLRRQPRRRFRLRARHLRRLRAVRLGQPRHHLRQCAAFLPAEGAAQRRAGAQLPRLCARQAIGA